MNISKYLTLEEATKSPTAIRLGIDNQPDAKQLTAMRYVAVNVFDKVRDFVGASLAASSFFRSHALNDAVAGSSKTSQHMDGEAIDIDADVYGHGTNLDIFNFIKLHLVFDQLILEYPNKEGKPSWVHVSLVDHPKHNRGQVLVKLQDTPTKKNNYIPFGSYEVGMV
jgi:zinc D-Ala-D-Ala carboxypeptidase